MRYDLVLSVGHDEYWSSGMRDNLHNFVRQGGNLAFFSGNTCWWRVHYVDNNTAMVCDRGSAKDQWFVLQQYEDSTTGTNYRNAGGNWHGFRPTVGYTVQHADNWVYRWTGLSDGDVFGNEPQLPVVGYECDGATRSNVPDKNGFVQPKYVEGTPPTFVILGYADIDANWDDHLGTRTATMGIFTDGGTVFTAATTDWPKAITVSPSVEQVTRNVLNGLASMRSKIETEDVSATTGEQIAGPVTSWQTPDGPYNVEHLAGMSPTGDLLVFYWSPQQTDWEVTNVSTVTGEQIAGPVKAGRRKTVTCSWRNSRRLRVMVLSLCSIGLLQQTGGLRDWYDAFP